MASYLAKGKHTDTENKHINRELNGARLASAALKRATRRVRCKNNGCTKYI
jgi:hypothetical protein